jgi:hypothetical protein
MGNTIDSDIEKLKKHIIDSNSGYGQEFKDRILGSLNAMKNPRPKDYLRFYIEKNFIEKDLYKAYEEIRNAAAHGKKADIEKIQDYLIKLSKVFVLVYKLVFLRIGYTGKYIDYGEFGYPDKEFKAKLN